MELHPILEPGDTPSPLMWYVLSPKGEPPSMRVGHTCTFLPGKDNLQGKVIIVGGANPSGAFNETHVLNLEFYEWDEPEWNGLRARYEHSAYVPESQPGKLYVFGGAEKDVNVNDVQVLDTSLGTWSVVSASGKPPSVRTCHSMTSIGDKLYIFSGGQAGAEPVGDRKVHVFDASTQTWSQPNIKGNSPKPRHGHVMVAIGTKIYIHGGMAGTTFYDDVHELDTVALSWRQVKCKGNVPCNRTAHTGVALNKKLYIFGGMNREGALDDMYVLDTGNFKWSKVDISGPPPPSRLDHCMCVIELKKTSREPGDSVTPHSESLDQIKDTEKTGDDGGTVENDSCAESKKEENDTGDEGACGGASEGGSEAPSAEAGAAAAGASSNDATKSAESNAEQRTYQLILIHGGMDTEGEIFDDTLVLYVQ
ncbi:rab9 effector protein with kelch motifs-like [Ptychodera flava]|uniref:rab9 effector protein with kelch motifs-like n=1 Tax=Ptychodera flava TaxID=63121 RepID=UPI003969F338